jgi:hypothetical protein
VPSEAIGAEILEGSTPKATVVGKTVRVQGPFPPGDTFLQVGFQLPAGRGSVQIDQRFPASFQTLAVMVKKEGDARLTSPQIQRQQEMPANGQTVIIGAGSAVPAGQIVSLTISGLPHHSPLGKWSALGLSGGIILAGVWFARRPTATSGQSERKRLAARKEKLLADLVRLETEHRDGRVDQGRYDARREQLLQALERVYGALDTDDYGPEPADRAGLAA